MNGYISPIWSRATGKLPTPWKHGGLQQKTNINSALRDHKLFSDSMLSFTNQMTRARVFESRIVRWAKGWHDAINLNMNIACMTYLKINLHFIPLTSIHSKKHIKKKTIPVKLPRHYWSIYIVSTFYFIVLYYYMYKCIKV